MKTLEKRGNAWWAEAVRSQVFYPVRTLSEFPSYRR
jgi:hypothetical protein